MGTETHTGRLIISEGQIALDDGTLLAVPGADPVATAAAQYSYLGQEQLVTVTGTPDVINNTRVLYVISIQPAAQAAGAMALPADLQIGDVDTALNAAQAAPAPAPAPAANATPQKKPATSKKSKKAAAAKSKKNGS